MSGVVYTVTHAQQVYGNQAAVYVVSYSVPAKTLHIWAMEMQPGSHIVG